MSCVLACRFGAHTEHTRFTHRSPPDIVHCFFSVRCVHVLSVLFGMFMRQKCCVPCGNFIRLKTVLHALNMISVQCVQHTGIHNLFLYTPLAAVVLQLIAISSCDMLHYTHVFCVPSAFSPPKSLNTVVLLCAVLPHFVIATCYCSYYCSLCMLCCSGGCAKK